MRKLVKLIPNTITSMNLISGSIGVILCLGGNIRIAFLLILLAAFFDFFDGLSARLLNAPSAIGKELDSLADLISFGLLPSIMMHKTLVEGGNAAWVCFTPLILAVFSAIRLAKFNIDERQHDSFIGLATPSAAMISGSLCYFVAGSNCWLSNLCHSAWFLPVLALILSLLLVSEIPMFSMKFGKGKSADKKTNTLRVIFLAGILVFAIIAAVLSLEWSLIILMSFIFYILLNVFSR